MSRAARRREGSDPVDGSPIHSRARSRRDASASASGPSGDPEADRELGDQRDARARSRRSRGRARRRAPSAAPSSTNVAASAASSRASDAPAELPLLGAHRQRRRQLVEGRPGRGGREPVEVVDEPGLKRGAHAGDERVRVQALERPGPVLGRHARQRRPSTAARTPAAPRRSGCAARGGRSRRRWRLAREWQRSGSLVSVGNYAGEHSRSARAVDVSARRAVLFGSPSSPMIVLSNVTKRFGPKILFENVTIQFDPGKRYGLTGANGAGKSTLLEMLAKQEDWDQGSIDIPPALKLGVLEQNHFTYDEQRILDTVMAGKAELWAAMVEKEKLLAGEVDDAIGVRLGELEGIIAEHDGYSAEGEAAELLVGLGIPAEKHLDPMRIAVRAATSCASSSRRCSSGGPT